MRRLRVFRLGLVPLACVAFAACGETEPPAREPGASAPAAPAADGERAPLRLAVLDCGRIVVEDLAQFGVTAEEVDGNELFVPCYLIEHAGGRLLWDGGLPPGVAEAPNGQTREGDFVLKLARALPEQLAELGLEPGEVDHVAFSHMHFDHVGHANLFPHAKLWIQRAEHEAAFSDPPPDPSQPPYFDQRIYGELAKAETELLDGDRDVFGDGRVTLISAPGHTPGHQVLLLDLDDFGPLLLSGDLWHFQVSRAQQRVPQFNVDAEQTLESMRKVEDLIDEVGATLWIEHDLELAETLEIGSWYE